MFKKVVFLILSLMTAITMVQASEVQKFKKLKNTNYFYSMSSDRSVITYIFRKDNLVKDIDNYKIQMKSVINKLCTDKDLSLIIKSGTKIQYIYITPKVTKAIMLSIDGCPNTKDIEKKLPIR